MDLGRRPPDSGTRAGKWHKRFDLGNQVALNGFRRGGHVLVAWFRNVVRGAEREGIEGCFRPSFRERAEHDDRYMRKNFANSGNGFQAIHFRHFDIQQNDVRAQRLELGQRQTAVAGPSGDGKVRIGRKDIGQYFPHNQGIVNDHDLNLRHRRLFQLGPSQLFETSRRNVGRRTLVQQASGNVFGLSTRRVVCRARWQGHRR